MQWSFNTRSIKISTLPIPLSRLPAEFDNYRITQISDFHLGTWLDAQALFEIVDLVNTLESDLIAITGDFVSLDPERYASSLIQALSKLEAKDTIVAVLGNHDYYTDSDQIREILRKSNIVDLSNQVHTIQRSTAYLYLAGIDDQITGHDDIEKVIELLPDHEAAVILLTHEPDFADISAKSGKFDLQISGHTHGGQIRLPYVGYLYLPRLGRKYPSGKYIVDDMVLYTNRGLGTSWLKLRYNCPPEIAVFNLQSCSE
jgi:predicted MPP superfamily phosphohydrolase